MKIGWFDFIPRRGIGLIVFASILIVAFIVGYLIRGGEDQGEVDGGYSSVQNDHGDETVSARWTCSMHPHIQLPSPGKCPICFMDLIPVETGAGDEEPGEHRLRMTNAAVKLASIETTPVVRRFVDAEIRMTGDIAYDETQVTYISAWVSGRLDHLFADYTGIRVKKGDRLVSIYSPALLSAQEELLQAGEALEAHKDGTNTYLKKTVEGTLIAAREKLRLYGLNERQIKEIESSGKTSDQLVIFSPVGGTVVKKHAFEGMYVETGTKIYTIAGLSKLWVKFDAFQTDLPWLQKGQKIEFTTISIPGERFIGKITFIDPVFEKATRTVKIRAEIDNSDGRLKPDMFVSGYIRVRLDKDGRAVGDDVTDPAEAPLVIPVTAPLLTGTRAVVYVRLPEIPEPVFEGREIELGPKTGDFYMVTSGLGEGELVVSNGAFKIDSELQIRARPSMMSAERENLDRPSRLPVKEMKHEHPAKGQDSLTPIYESYFKVQMALAGDDLPLSSKRNRDLEKTIKGIDISNFEGISRARWKELSIKLIETARTGASAKEISVSRDAFYSLSEAIIALHETFGHKGDKDYFLTFCPMTNENKGAYWLQAIDTVYNSFYGASMLRCGSIEGKLAPSK